VEQGAEIVIAPEAAKAAPAVSAASQATRPDLAAPAPIEAPILEPDDTPQITAAAKGAVRRPGVYGLDPGSRVQDLIEAAGGQLDEADLSDINLAAKLIDGSTLTLPSRGTALVEGRRIELRAGQQASALNPPEYTLSGWHASAGTNAPSPSTAPGKAAVAPPAEEETGPVNLNTATAERLDTLPGVGPVTAQKIIDYRTRTPFISIDDLKNINGIGEKKFEALRPLVTVQ
jgi:competence protein ComEA